jgi:hypothetical protein
MREHDDKILEALQGMWSEMKAVNARIDEINATLEEMTAQLGRFGLGPDRDGAINARGDTDLVIERFLAGTRLR